MTGRDRAYRKWQTLARMTVERGCTPHEAATAARLRASLAARWGFGGATTTTAPPRDYQARYERAEQRAAQRFRWEYRSCGKKCATCAGGPAHGPYKYGKKRDGRTVRSIYLGR